MGQFKNDEEDSDGRNPGDEDHGKTAPTVDKGRPEPEVLHQGQVRDQDLEPFTGEDDRLYCGIWESTPGKVPIDYKEWEFCHFIEGKAVLTNEQGQEVDVKAGDGFIIPPGFKGTWETVEKVRSTM